MTGVNTFSVSGYGPERSSLSRLLARDSLARSAGVGEIIVANSTGTLTTRCTTTTASAGNPSASPLESADQDATDF